VTDLWQPNNARTRSVMPISDEMKAKIMADARAIRHRQQRPDGLLQPTPNELRWTLAIVVAVIFACFAVAA
jgi:hypothetical protein